MHHICDFSYDLCGLQSLLISDRVWSPGLEWRTVPRERHYCVRVMANCAWEGLGPAGFPFPGRPTCVQLATFLLGRGCGELQLNGDLLHEKSHAARTGGGAVDRDRAVVGGRSVAPGMPGGLTTKRVPVGAGLPAMAVNDDASIQDDRSVWEFFAGKPAPTVEG